MVSRSIADVLEPPLASDEELTRSLGLRLREARQDAGLSLRELSRRIEVSPGLLSQIENGLTRPSVGTLYALVGELRISIDRVFDTKHAPDDRQSPGGVAVQRAGDRPVLELDGGVRWERLGDDGDTEMVFALVTYDPVGDGDGGAERPHIRHPGREHGYVESGRLEVEIGDRVVELGVGDAISFGSDEPHRFRALGGEPARAVWFNLPPMR